MNNPGMHEKLRLESILTGAQRDAKREAVAMERECDFGFGQQSFHNDIVFNDLVEAFWQFFGDAEEYISLELGSGLGSWSSHMATAGVQAYGVEKHQYLVDASEEAVDRAEEQGLIEKRGLCQYTQGDVTAEDTWEFEGGEIGIEDADIVYANFPRGDISNTVVEGMAREMDKEAIAVIPDGGYEASNQYFEEAGITDFDFVYELDSRP